MDYTMIYCFLASSEPYIETGCRKRAPLIPTRSDSGSDSYEVASSTARHSATSPPRPSYSDGTKTDKGEHDIISRRTNGGRPLVRLISSRLVRSANRFLSVLLY
jgi:hypothetical protein